MKKRKYVGTGELENVSLRGTGDILLLYGKVFDFYWNGTYTTLSEGKTIIIGLLLPAGGRGGGRGGRK